MPYSRCRGAQISGVAEVGENMRESRSVAFAGSVLPSALNSRVSAKVAACCALASTEPGIPLAGALRVHAHGGEDTGVVCAAGLSQLCSNYLTPLPWTIGAARCRIPVSYDKV